MPSVLKSDERRFWKALCRLFNPLIRDLKSGQLSPADAGRGTRQIMRSEEMTRYLDNLIARMVRTQREASARSWREAALRGGNAPEIQRLIRHEMDGPVGEAVWRLISGNAAYIRTLPEDWARYASEYAYREALKGRRPEDVEAELRRVMPDHITKNLKCVARTECAKANAAIVQARAEMCGVRAYIWRSVGDERSRHSHTRMDGVLVFYDDPPSPEALFPGSGKPYGRYHAGDTFNCRCFQEPVIADRFLPDTIRVHDHGRIAAMTRAQILKSFGEIA